MSLHFDLEIEIHCFNSMKCFVEHLHDCARMKYQELVRLFALFTYKF